MVQKLIPDKGEVLSCGQSIVITDDETGEMICEKCGRVLQEKISEKRKERSFQGVESTSRIGDRTSIAIHDMGLSTNIGRSNSDSVGRSLSFKMKYSMARMRLWDSRIKANSTSERNLRFVLYEMYKLKDKLGLSEVVIERAAYIYRKATKARLVRGRSMKSMLGACLYVACREMDTTRTIIEISNQLQEKPKRIAKSYRTLFQNLKLTIPIPDTINSIIKIANNLKISEKTKREAIKIYDILKEKKLTAGKNPLAVATTVIYLAGINTNANLTQREITEFSGITGVTIRNRLKDYRKYLELV